MLNFEEKSLIQRLERVAGTHSRPSLARRGAAALALLVVGAGLLGAAGLIGTNSGVIPAGRAASVAGMTPDPASPSDTESVTAGSETLLASLRSAPGQDVQRTFLESGDTLSSALSRLGVADALQGNLIATIGGYINPRRLPRGTGLSSILGPAGTPTHVALRTEPERFLRLTLPRNGADAIRAELIKLPVVTTLETLGGTVESSVAQAFSHSPHGVYLTNAFADVFQWDVDLLIDPRPGDTVRIVYEAQRLGEVPDDLPEFARSPSQPGDFLKLGRVLAANYEGLMARSAGFWIDGADGVGGYYDDLGAPLRKAFLKSPLNYRRISSGFSRARRNPVTRKVVPHHGVDFAAATGTPVVATAAGRVSRADWNGALGRAVRINHGGTFTTIYGHLSGFAPGIKKGVEVKQNQVIGYVGSTGRATGPHLHYTLIQSGRAINPMTFENPPAKPLSTEDTWRLAEAKRRWLPVMNAVPVTRPTDAYQLASTDASGPILRPGS